MKKSIRLCSPLCTKQCSTEALFTRDCRCWMLVQSQSVFNTAKELLDASLCVLELGKTQFSESTLSQFLKVSWLKLYNSDGPFSILTSSRS